MHDRGAILRAEEKSTGEIHVAIDLAVDKLYRQIERFKGKKIDKRRQGSRYYATPEELQTAEVLPVEVVDATIPVTVPPLSEFEVVRRKQIELIPMDENEAIEQMELLAHSFFMFYNVDTGKVNVLYRRYDGGYGLLEPSA
jgi:putative sigma-54 modulation protein